MDRQQIIIDISAKEMTSGCYDVQIEGVRIYSLIRRVVRAKFLEQEGMKVMAVTKQVDKLEIAKSFFQSIWHLSRLYCSNRHYSTVLFAFPRVDKVNGLYLDKFTDPLIEEGVFGNDYIILDHGRGGVHPQPRLHKKNIIYVDSLHALAALWARWKRKSFLKKHLGEWAKLQESIIEAFGEITRIEELVNQFLPLFYYSVLLRNVMAHIGAKRVIGPARQFLNAPFIAAHQLGLTKFELQHGITYGETLLYSGYRDEMLRPDYFLAFGDNKPLNVYGIDEDRIITIGWALQNYIEKIPQQEHYKQKDVLVISEPTITDALIEVVLPLAKATPDSTFYLRPHPHEIISEEHRARMSSVPNLVLQDKSMNITIVLQGFTHVLGENSTVLYEALAVHKKVGRLFGAGLNPRYLEDSDRDAFWEIHSVGDFKTFLNGNVAEKTNKCIYSPFDKEKFLEVIGLQS